MVIRRRAKMVVIRGGAKMAVIVGEGEYGDHEGRERQRWWTSGERMKMVVILIRGGAKVVVIW